MKSIEQIAKEFNALHDSMCGDRMKKYRKNGIKMTKRTNALKKLKFLEVKS